MRLLIQRVKQARVDVAEACVGAIRQGLLVFVGIHKEDTQDLVQPLIDKLLSLRIFSDDAGKMNRSVMDIQGEVLLVSQFTLYANCSKGHRPSFLDSAKAEHALPLYEHMVNVLRRSGCRLQTGKFGAMMQVGLINDGPVTILLDTKKEEV